MFYYSAKLIVSTNGHVQKIGTNANATLNALLNHYL